MAEIRKGCVVNCSEDVCQLPMHEFPKDDISRNVWLKQLGLHKVKTHAYVCNRHFSAKMRPNGQNLKLTRWAIPDMNLPKPAEVIELDDDYTETQSMMDISDIIDEDPIPNGHDAEHNNSEEVNDICMTNNNSGTINHNNSAADNSFVDEALLDFDELLAKVHCISDLPKNNNANNYSEDSIDSMDTMDYDVEQESMAISPSNATQIPNGHEIVIDEDTVSRPMSPVEINSRFKKKLIASVRRRRILYDSAHPSFSNIEKKTRAWERIGKIHKLEAAACRELWLNMRYDYQNYVRNLRRWLAGESHQQERPRISFENDLLFLWRYIPDKNYCDEKDDVPPLPHTVGCQTDVLDKTVLSEAEKSLIANDYARSVDHPYANHDVGESYQFNLNLIDAVKYYSELYDPLHPNYGDPKRKSIIWEAISNELKTKATKCLYTWIHLTIRYEFEIKYEKSSYLITKMEFLKKHIIPNEKTPFKCIRTFGKEWSDALCTSHDQHLLLRTMISMKKFRPHFASIDVPNDVINDQPSLCWIPIGHALKRKPEQCEVTWILMKTMYLEITELQRNGCPLPDEWEYEAVINKFKSTLSITAPLRPPKFPKPSIPKPPPVPEVEPEPEPEPEPQLQPAPEHEADIATEIDFEKAIDMAEPPLNEIRFTIPGLVTPENPTGEPQLVRFNLDTPLKDLPEKAIVEIGSVLEDAHIVLVQQFKKPPEIHLFTLEKRKELIAEVMARPLVFNEPCKLARLSRVYWGEISLNTSFPADICMFFWDYIVEKSFFVDYDPNFKKIDPPKWIPPPMPVFDKFQKFADTKEWGEHVNDIADFLREVSHFPLLHVELKINSNWNRRQCYTRDLGEVWSILIRKFAVLDNHKIIWEKFKHVFQHYMSDMELSIYNPWPKLWAPALEKLAFLCDVRYSPKDPIYYVIKSKIKDEIEEYKRINPPLFPDLGPVSNARALFRLLKDNEYLSEFNWLNRARFIAKLKSLPVLYNISDPQFGNREAKYNAWQEIAIYFHCTVSECHLIFQHLMKGFLMYRARDPNQICRVNAKFWENMTYIYACAIPNAVDSKLIEGRTFRSSTSSSTIKLAEEYQAEISLVDAKPTLVLKNFGSAVNSLPVQIQPSVMQQIKYIFTDYIRGQGEEIVVDV